MMRETTGVEFRAVGELPTKSGWYYGRSISRGKDSIIQPRYVGPRFGDELSVDMHTSSMTGRLDEFDWFGEVREVREASS